MNLSLRQNSPTIIRDYINHCDNVSAGVVVNKQFELREVMTLSKRIVVGTENHVTRSIGSGRDDPVISFNVADLMAEATIRARPRLHARITGATSLREYIRRERAAHRQYERKDSEVYPCTGV